MIDTNRTSVPDAAADATTELRDRIDWVLRGAIGRTALGRGSEKDLADRVMDVILEHGGAALLGAATDQAVLDEMVRRRIPVHVGLYEHQHGSSATICTTAEGLKAVKLGIALEYWTRDRADRDLPDDPEGLSDEQILDGFWRDNEREFFSEETTCLVSPSIAEPAPGVVLQADDAEEAPAPAP